MRILVNRDMSTARSLGSKVSISLHEALFTFFCFGLEPFWDPTQTIKPRAIPPGTYPVKRLFSPKHNRVVPHVMNVPGFEDIEIHWGNFEFEHEGADGKMHPPDSLACLVVGKSRGTDEVLTSVPVFANLDTIIAHALAAGDDVWITYTNSWDGANG